MEKDDQRNLVSSGADQRDSTPDESSSPRVGDHEETLSIGSVGAQDRPSTSGELPQSLGRYRIIRVLGEGGMGVVYEAEQEHPHRRVALKIMRQGHAVDEVHARLFQREAETLARLKHPNIAAIYESDHTEDGRDFFVMELVRGETLGRWLERRGAARDRNDLEIRLRIFLNLCNAVHYAHQKGVIHRDLKPSNIVVATPPDSSSSQPRLPTIKILDFGLAKIADETRVQSTISGSGQVRGTLAYMSPEQARGASDEIDVRSDVYSLGVILYELLSGIRPYDLSQASLMAAVKIICEQTPRPLRQAGPAMNRIDVDLETIVAKAMEKQQDQRYPSALALANDVYRFLNSEPINARPPSAAYKLRKFARRHRALVVSGTVAVLSLVMLSVGLLIQSRAIAVERDRAEHEAANARAVTDFLIELFQESDPSRARGAEVTAQQLLDRGAQRLDRLDHQPLTQAAFRETIGRVYLLLGRDDKAHDLLTDALATREELGFGDDRAAVTALTGLANVHLSQGQPEEALDPARRAVEICRREFGTHPRTAEALNTLGNCLWHLDRLDEAEQIHREALDIRERTLRSDSPKIAQSLHNLGALRYFAGDFAGAEDFYRRSIAIEEKQGENNWNLATSLHTLAIVYQDQGRLEEALELEERALETRVHVLGEDHPHVALSLTTRGNIYRALGRADQAVADIRQALEIVEDAWPEDHPEKWWMQRSLARAEMMAGDLGAAERILDDLGATIEHAGAEQDLPLNMRALAEVYLQQGRLAEAETLYDRLLTIQNRVDPGGAFAALLQAGLADVARAAGRIAEAESLYREALPVLENTWGADDRDTRRVRNALDDLKAER